MILQLLLVHILNSLDHNILTIAVLLCTIFRIIIIIDVHIIIVDNLNDFGRRTLTQLHMTEAHRIKLGLQLRVVDVATLRIVVIGRTVLLAVLISIWTAISGVDSADGFRIEDILFGDLDLLRAYVLHISIRVERRVLVVAAMQVAIAVIGADGQIGRILLLFHFNNTI